MFYINSQFHVPGLRRDVLEDSVDIIPCMRPINSLSQSDCLLSLCLPAGVFILPFRSYVCFRRKRCSVVLLQEDRKEVVEKEKEEAFNPF